MPPPSHPIRTALLALLRERETITSTEAARELDLNSGLCSFHLRQLARFGLVEEAPTRRAGRVRPWRLVSEPDETEDDLGNLTRELEDEGYQRWLRHRHTAPPEWSRDEAFSAVVFLDPDELHAVAEEIRSVLSRYVSREHDPVGRPAGARPVAAITRLFPLLPADTSTNDTTEQEEKPPWRYES